MVKRKLRQYQKKTARDAQDTIHSSSQNHIKGTVISHHGGKIVVESPQGELLVCVVKANLGGIVCGDIVYYEKTPEAGFRVLAIQTRRNLLQRVDGFGNLKSVAANLSQLLVCLAVKPAPNFFLLDQYLLSAEQQGINAVIILNKADLLPGYSIDPFNLKSVYEPLGYQVLLSSAKTADGMDQLRPVLDDNTSVLSGASGVGKSSITKALLPQIDVKIGALSEANEEGRHTTRTSRLYHLPDNGHLIDTPGVRGFNPVLDDKIPVSAGFREVNRFASECRFNNCRHINEPDCAVIDAVSRNEITKSRYQHYLRLAGK